VQDEETSSPFRTDVPPSTTSVAFTQGAPVRAAEMIYSPLTHVPSDDCTVFKYSAFTRAAASITFAVFCSWPLFALGYPILLLFRETHAVLPLSVTAALACAYTTRAILNAVVPRRPAAADGCRPDDAPAPRRRVAVVGAGVSGLLTAKELLAEGHDVAVFEAAAAVGGAWSVDGKIGRGRVWHGTVSSSSAVNTGISDFPLQSYWPGTENPFHVPQAAFCEYLVSYSKQFDLMPLIRFQSKVLSVVRCGEKWRVIYKAVGEKEAEDDFEFVAVCTGQVEVPKLPVYKGQDRFKGRVAHIAYVRNAGECDGKDVVCVGAGETGADTVELVSAAAHSCFLSVRNPMIVLPRNFYGVAPDFFENRALYLGPFWLRWIVLKLQVFSFPLLQIWDCVHGKAQVPSAAPDWRRLLAMFCTRQLIYETASMHRTPCNSLLVTKSERFMYALDDGSCTLKPAVSELDESSVVFADGSRVNCNFLLLCTGYKEYFPMFEADPCCALSHSKARGRYLLTFDPEVGSSVAFIGFCRGQAGSLVIPSELQARWFALIVSGKRVLPSREEMRNAIARAVKGNKGYAATLGGWFFANYIARYCVGCEPSFLRLVAKHGIVVAWRVYTQSFAAYMFRFEGPHAKPRLARHCYQTVATCGKHTAWVIVDILLLLYGVLFDMILSIPFLGKLRPLNSLMDRWW
jgi:Flavin-binding monooxygenase-like